MAWLKSVLTRLPEWPKARLHELLPFPENPGQPHE
ncbi:transposase domain-containing protein [Serratia microhaemolytica]